MPEASELPQGLLPRSRLLQQMLGCNMKTAWHLGHRIRLAMAPGGDAGPLGGAGKTVEADKTELSKSRKTNRPAKSAARLTILWS